MYRFDLDKAIAAWRRSLRFNRVFLREDLDELEAHLRDHVEWRAGQGITEEKAFREALARLGDRIGMESEYRKVRWGRTRRAYRLAKTIYWEFYMFRNYLTVAVRNLRKQMGYTVLNLVGLTVGLACFILILRYVEFERSYDRFHEKADRIYRVYKQEPGNLHMGSDYFAVVQAGMAAALRADIPEVESATVIAPATWGPAPIAYKDHVIFNSKGIMADSCFLDVFSFPLTRGNQKTALNRPDAILLTDSLSHVLFGEEDPIGKVVRFDDRIDYTVTGIVSAPPLNSHFSYSFIASLQSDERFTEGLGNWGSSSWYTYIVLKNGVSPEIIDSRLAQIKKKYLEAESTTRYLSEPLTRIHLYSHINFNPTPSNDVRYLYVLLAIGFVILLLACVNYTNLAVARSIQRAREVGLRKVVGAGKLQLAVQYLGESMLVALVAMIMALVLAWLALPLFEHWMDRDLDLNLWNGGGFFFQVLGITILVGLVSGSYPALILTNLRPVLVIKGEAGKQFGRSWLRSMLVVGQYTAAIALAAGSLIIYQQLHFIQTTDPGYNRENVVSLNLRGFKSADVDTWMKQLEQNPRILAVTLSSDLPANVGSSTHVFKWEGSPEDADVLTYQLETDPTYLQIFDIPLVEGRFFSPEFPSDSSGAFVINETAARRLGWKSGAGKQLEFQGVQGTVIGVVKDFHQHSMHQAIEPLVIRLVDRDWLQYKQISIRIRPDDIVGTLAYIEKTHGAFSTFPFDYQFVDQAFDQLYRSELKLAEAIRYFTFIALLIASLGLFGLAAYAAERRTKEIGIRKVMGASLTSLIRLLSQDFVRLVLLASVLALPLAWWAMNRWLDNFAYHVNIGPVTLLVAAVCAVIIALATVSLHAIRAAGANPVKSLRYE